MIKGYSTYNMVNENLREIDNFTLKSLGKKWGNLDQVLVDANRKTRNKMVRFSPFQNEEKFIKIIVKSIYYKRFVKENEKMGNSWFFIDENDKEYQINVNGQITTYTKVNQLDPWGEEDWDD